MNAARNRRCADPPASLIMDPISLATVDGLAALAEGGRALKPVGGIRQQGRQVCLQPQTVGDRHLDAAPDCLLRVSDGDRELLRQFSAPAERPAGVSSSQGTTSLTRPMRKASSASMRSPVRISRIACPSPTTRGRRWVPPAPGMRARRTLGRRKMASLDAMREIARQGHLQPPAEADSLDRGDRRLAARGNQVIPAWRLAPFPLRVEGVRRLELLDVRASAERPVACPANDDGADLAVGLGRLNSVGQDPPHLEVDDD